MDNITMENGLIIIYYYRKLYHYSHILITFKITFNINKIYILTELYLDNKNLDKECWYIICYQLLIAHEDMPYSVPTQTDADCGCHC